MPSEHAPREWTFAVMQAVSTCLELHIHMPAASSVLSKPAETDPIITTSHTS